jgi:hypothetical protein
MTASKEEIESWTEVFSLFDADGNGKISADELQLGLESLGTKKRQQSILGMIDSVDVDGDRQLDIGEFINLVQTKELDMIFEGDQRLELKREQLIVGLGNIYGQTPTPEETEDYVKAGLELLQKELGAIGNDQKEGYNEALEKCPHLIDDNFLLMFLRTEVFHAEVSFWIYLFAGNIGTPSCAGGCGGGVSHTQRPSLIPLVLCYCPPHSVPLNGLLPTGMPASKYLAKTKLSCASLWMVH